MRTRISVKLIHSIKFNSAKLLKRVLQFFFVRLVISQVPCICYLFNDAVSNLDNIASTEWVIMNGLERLCK
jgi:hypothetical protein